MTALTMAPAWADTVAALEPISLEELNTEAALQTRVDRKYIVPVERWSEVFASLGGDFRILEQDGRRGFGYESDYYDTPGLAAYYDAAHRRPRRYKVRTRHYLDSGLSAIEVKLRSARGETVKHREWLPTESARATQLSFESRTFVGSFAEIANEVGELSRVLTTSYERTTLVGGDARVTIDSGVSATGADGRTTGFGDALIVETKSASRAGSVDRALWAHGIRPVRVSKYCTSLAALQPELPSNRWARTLRRHIADSPTSTVAY
ncbi:polyphosphate polymerase domain-containing protein [Demequina aurantiaca]|uniref:polyphosphate polymerase domain-containing protein n=1 Tax=Demequina aurantiaca TaxID=676200 RepID=UPI003D35732B